MGKVRTISLEEQELKAKEAAAKEAERLAKIAQEKAKGQAAKSPKGTSFEEAAAAGQAKKSPATEETAKPETNTVIAQEEEAEQKKSSKKTVSKYAAKKGAKGRERSENYTAAVKLIDKSKLYSVKEALGLLEKAHLAKFDETVELHINTTQPGIAGQITLPHGTGKKVRVAILAPSKDQAAADALLKEVEAGKINFDVLIATPDAMPKLAKVAKVLGPKGLMPNPKNGTVTPNPEAVAKQYEGGQMHFKTEAKMPLIHAAVGKLSFGEEKLAENITAFLKAVKMENIKKVVIKSTMSPAIRLQLGK